MSFFYMSCMFWLRPHDYVAISKKSDFLPPSPVVSTRFVSGRCLCVGFDLPLILVFSVFAFIACVWSVPRVDSSCCILFFLSPSSILLLAPISILLCVRRCAFALYLFILCCVPSCVPVVLSLLCVVVLLRIKPNPFEPQK